MKAKRMIGRFVPAVAAVLILLPVASADAAPVPAWNLQALAAPTGFAPGDASGLDRYEVFLTNIGSKASDPNQPVVITDTLPAGLKVKQVTLRHSRTALVDLNESGTACHEATVVEVTTVTCRLEEGLAKIQEPARFEPLKQALMVIKVVVPSVATLAQLVNHVEVQGGGAEAVNASSQSEVNPVCKTEPKCASAGFQDFQFNFTDEEGHQVRGAASHPFQAVTSFALKLNPSPEGSQLPFLPAGGDLKELEVTLPPGLIANPLAAERCTAQQFNTVHVELTGSLNAFQNKCPDGSAVGVAVVAQIEGKGEVGFPLPVYSLVPPPGMPAQFGFLPALGAPVYIDTAVRQGPHGLTVKAYLENVTEAKRVTASLVSLWGTPWDPSHDAQRGRCAQLVVAESCPAPSGEPIPPGGEPIPIRPSFRLPTSCADPLTTLLDIETWAQPPTGASASVEAAAPDGCDEVDFSPAIEAKPTTEAADSPSGLRFNLHLPQAANDDPDGLAEADLRDAVVRMPEGMTLNPAASDGLAACSPAQIGLQSPVGQAPPVFDEAPAACPDAAKVGRVEVDSPLLDHPIPGQVFLAQQTNNPFGSLFAIYMALEDPRSGIEVKLAGRVTPDPVTGQLTTSFEGNPQVPFEDLRFTFFDGARAPLRTPATCGSFTTEADLTPWSAPEGAAASPTGSFSITSSPAGACQSAKAALPNSPSFEAGTEAPLAGAFSPFLLRLKREDGSQELSALTVNLPAGLSAKLAGVAECSDAQITAARAREVPGGGAAEQASPSCPAAARVGTVTVGAGAGPNPYYVTGSAYLAGPYEGAPLSLAIITPAVAGPFDLGAVVVRSPLRVDPQTAKVSSTAKLPTILQGIPLDVRSVAVRLDRSQFTLNPTSCETMALTAQATSTSGKAAELSNRFQVGSCSKLGFKPSLKLSFKGGTKRTRHPALRSVLTFPKKGSFANIAKAAVTLPHSEIIDPEHVGNPCTRPQFAEERCPKLSILGRAKAWTPLLDKPLEGKVYFRANGGERDLPDIVVDLRGQIRVELIGAVDTATPKTNARIRTTFFQVPDAPVSRFELELKGGKEGLLVNSQSLCRSPQRAGVRFAAQNGRVVEPKTVVTNQCPKKHGRR